MPDDDDDDDDDDNDATETERTLCCKFVALVDRPFVNSMLLKDNEKFYTWLSFA